MYKKKICWIPSHAQTSADRHLGAFIYATTAATGSAAMRCNGMGWKTKRPQLSTCLSVSAVSHLSTCCRRTAASPIYFLPKNCVMLLCTWPDDGTHTTQHNTRHAQRIHASIQHTNQYTHPSIHLCTFVHAQHCTHPVCGLPLSPPSPFSVAWRPAWCPSSSSWPHPAAWPSGPTWPSAWDRPSCCRPVCQGGTHTRMNMYGSGWARTFCVSLPLVSFLSCVLSTAASSSFAWSWSWPWP